MSRDIFATDVADGPPSRVVHYGLGGAQNEIPSNLVPADPEMQRLMDRINAEEDIEIARKEAEMDTPENRQKALEAEVAARERKKINFQFGRAIPNFLDEGWKHIGGQFVDEEIRVYTTDYERNRFWGIKPAGMAMWDFWDLNDPEVGRYDDNVAMTWANPLIRPPVTASDEINPVIWAGRGLNPDSTPREPPIAKALPSIENAAKPRRRQKTPDVNPTHRVRKSTTESPKVNKNTRRSLANKIGAGLSQLGDQVREVAVKTHANGRPTRNQTAITASDAQQKPISKEGAMKDANSALTKRPRGRPAAKTNPAAQKETSKRPRGRPPAKKKLAEESVKQKKTPAVKGNAKVTKSSKTRSSKTKSRPSAPSTHRMRTRGDGPAELLQLP